MNDVSSKEISLELIEYPESKSNNHLKISSKYMESKFYYLNVWTIGEAVEDYISYLKEKID